MHILRKLERGDSRVELGPSCSNDLVLEGDHFLHLDTPQTKAVVSANFCLCARVRSRGRRHVDVLTAGALLLSGVLSSD